MDVLIIGGGPAGVSTALYAVRGGLDVAIVTMRGGALLKAHKIENFYGHADGISGENLYDAGQRQARELGVKIIEAEATAVSYAQDGYEVRTTAGTYSARAVVLACGAGRKTLSIPGIAEYEGRGVSYCAVCDAFFYRNKTVAVLGNGDYALEEAEVLSRTAIEISILTNGLPAPETTFPVRTERIAEIVGDDTRVTGVRFENGNVLPTDGLFVALGVAGSTTLASKLGAETLPDRVVVNEFMQTTVPNVYAVGDCTGGLKQVATAAQQGAVAGLDLVRTLKKK